MEGLDSNAGIAALLAAGVALVALALAIGVAIRMRKLRSEQKRVLGEAGERDLVEHAAAISRRVDGLQTGLDDISRVLFERIDDHDARIAGAVTRTAVIRYDAFREGSGQQSSSLALLDSHGTGVVLSAILQREQARVYVKPVETGNSPLSLSPEEDEAIQTALATRAET